MTGELASLDRQIQMAVDDLRDAAMIQHDPMAMRQYVARIDSLTARLLEIRAALSAMQELTTGPLSPAWQGELQAAIDRVRGAVTLTFWLWLLLALAAVTLWLGLVECSYRFVLRAIRRWQVRRELERQWVEDDQRTKNQRYATLVEIVAQMPTPKPYVKEKP